jgi:anti-sigma B factor antagonist
VKATIGREGDVAVLVLSGRVMGGPDADTVGQRIRECLDRGSRKILVDVGEVTWVSSSGLGILIFAQARVVQAGGVMKLSRVTHRLRQIFMVTKLHQVFDSYETNEEALRSYAK